MDNYAAYKYQSVPRHWGRWGNLSQVLDCCVTSILATAPESDITPMRDAMTTLETVILACFFCYLHETGSLM